MGKRFLKHGISVLVLAALIALCFGSATTDGVVDGVVDEVFSEQQVLENIEYKEVPVDELESNIANVSADGHGFIVKAYVVKSFVYQSSYLLKSDRRTWGMRLEYTQDFLTKYPDVDKQLEEDRQYTFYVAVHNLDKNGKKGSSSGGSFHPNRYKGYITKIDGLRSVAEVTAAKEAAEAAKKAELEKKRNPKGLNRSLYKEVKAEDFSFDMVAGNLKAGAKVCFKATFYTKPTGTEYRFDDVAQSITLTSDHNFVRDISNEYLSNRYFESYYDSGLNRYSQWLVKIYVTVKKSGQYGECSVDIVEW